MRNLIFKIYASFQPKLCAAALLTMFLAAVVFAQGTGSSVVIYDKTKPGSGEANAISNYLVTQIGKGLQKEYPCVDWISTDMLKDLLKLERDQTLLTGEQDDEKIIAVAGSLAARYLIVVNVTTLPNGESSVSAKVIDTKTARAVADRMVPPASGDAALDSAEQVAKNLMQDLASVFKNQCQPHWTGTLSYSFRREWEDSQTGGGIPGAMESNVKSTNAESDSKENTIEVQLQPMTLGSERNSTMARVTRKLSNRFLRLEERTSTWLCRASGGDRQPKEVSVSGKTSEIETGVSTAVLPVYIYVDSTGAYQIRAAFPALKYKREEERSGTRTGCEPDPFSESNASEGELEAGYFEASGQVDPETPDVLAGKQVIGNLTDGQYTTVWNLRLVKPKQKEKPLKTGRSRTN